MPGWWVWFNLRHCPSKFAVISQMKGGRVSHKNSKNNNPQTGLDDTKSNLPLIKCIPHTPRRENVQCVGERSAKPRASRKVVWQEGVHHTHRHTHTFLSSCFFFSSSFFLHPNKQSRWSNEAPGCSEDTRWEGDLATQNVKNEHTGRGGKSSTASLGNYERWWQPFISSANDSPPPAAHTHTHTCTCEHINTDTVITCPSGRLQTCEITEDMFKWTVAMLEIVTLPQWLTKRWWWDQDSNEET